MSDLTHLTARLAARQSAVLAGMTEAQLLQEQADRLERLQPGDPAGYITHTISELQAISGELRVRLVTRPAPRLAHGFSAALAIVSMLLGFGLGVHYAIAVGCGQATQAVQR